MTVALILEDFDAKPKDKSVAAVPQGETEADRLKAYDAAYKEGWDDANSAQSHEQEHIGAEFARNLQDLSFTFHEARVQVTQSIGPLLTTIITQLFPRLSTQALAENLLSVVLPLAEELNTPDLALLCAPSDVETLGQLIGTGHGLTTRLQPESSLMAGQVKFSFGQEVHEIDVSKLQSEIDNLVAEQLKTPAPTTNHEEFSNVG